MAGETAPARLSVETAQAARSAFQIGLSLFATWSVAIVVRLYLPRHVGPDEFGMYTFAEGLATTAIALLTLGVEAYTLRELSTRPAHGSDFFGGMVALRAGLGAIMLAGIAFALYAMGRQPLEIRLAVTFGIGCLAASVAGLLGAFLQANATVGRLSVVNVAAKLVWGALVVAALALGLPLEFAAGAFVLSEALKAILLYRETRSRMGLAFRVDPSATLAVIVASVPFFANTVALSLNRLDVTVLGFLAGESEVGWYGAASSFSLLVFLFTPLMSSVVLPTLARVRARSDEDFRRVMARLSEGLIVATAPIALLVALGADLWVRLVFGEAFAAAAVSLRVLAGLALLSYLTSLLSMALITLGKNWTVTTSSVVGLVVNPLLGALLIPVCARIMGPGGAGAGAGLGVVGMELVIVLLQVRATGSAVVAPRTIAVACRCALACLVTVGLHLLFAGLGYWRLVLDAVVYAVAALALGVLPVKRVIALVRELVESRRSSAAGPGGEGQ